MSELIYLDNAATTKVAPEVYEAMNPYFEEYYGNAASVYRFAGESKKAVENARKEVADFLGAKPNEIYFTGGGSESDNWALKGLAFSLRNKGKHIITSAIEHHAILHTCEYLEKLGYEITYVGVDENGILKLDELEQAIREDTILISVMFANNEIGSIQPIKEIGEIAKKHKVLFHTDAVQAYGHVPINVDEYHIDLLSASGHPLAGKKSISFSELEPYPCLSFEQGNKNSFYFAEEVLSNLEYKQTIKADDRATMLNLMTGLNGYTLCSGIICEELNGDGYTAVPFAAEETMTIGYLKRKGIPLSHLGSRYIEILKQYEKNCR